METNDKKKSELKKSNEMNSVDKKLEDMTMEDIQLRINNLKEKKEQKRDVNPIG